MIILGYFFLFSFKPYNVTPHLNCLEEMVQMRGHNVCFYAEITKIIPNCHKILPLDIKSSEVKAYGRFKNWWTKITT